MCAPEKTPVSIAQINWSLFVSLHSYRPDNVGHLRHHGGHRADLRVLYSEGGFCPPQDFADAEAIIGITGLAGLAGSRLYHLLESPAEFFADPWPQLFSTMGFAFFGAVIGGLIALLVLARRFKIRALLMLDVASPAAALGYGIGRIGCLISGDGDYGIPTSLPWGMSFPDGIVPTTQTCVERGWPANCRVQPTPIYEFLGALLIFWFLWKLGERCFKTNAPYGLVFAAYLILTGVARFLVEFIRINPQHRSLLGMSNAQAASVVSIIAGIVLYLSVRRPATKLRHA